jgi:hypothetical protein
VPDKDKDTGSSTTASKDNKESGTTVKDDAPVQDKRQHATDETEPRQAGDVDTRRQDRNANDRRGDIDVNTAGGPVDTPVEGDAKQYVSVATDNDENVILTKGNDRYTVAQEKLNLWIEKSADGHERLNTETNEWEVI